jgi:hypothetical protein
MKGKAFQKRLNLQWLADARNASSFDLAIPAHKRLLIRQISGIARMPAGVTLTSIEINTSVGPSNLGENIGALYVTPHFVGTEDGPTNVPNLYVFNQSVLAFAEGPNAAQVLASRTPAAIPANQPQGEVDMTVFGELVELD